MTHEPPRCPVCGSRNSELWARCTDREYRTTDDVFSFYRCPDCRTLHVDPVPADRLSVIYPENYYSFAGQKASLTTRIKDWLDARHFRALLNRIPGDDLSVLDVGGGTGWLLDVLKRVDRRIAFTQVVDLDSRAAAQARVAGHQYFEGRIEDFESDRKFDLVLLLNLIEHVADPREVLANVGRLLADDGLVLVKTPNHESLDAWLLGRGRWGGLHCPRHWVLFSRRSFLRTADDAGLAVDRFGYTQGAPFWSWSVLFLLEEWGMVRITRERPAIFHPLYPLLAALFAGFDFLRRPFFRTSQMFFTLRKRR